MNNDKRNDDLSAIDQTIQESMSQTIKMYGGSRSLGQIYSTLYLHHGAMTLDDLRDQTGMSKGSMSLGVRRLLDEKLIERVYKREERKDLYQISGEFTDMFSSFFTKLWRKDVEMNVAVLLKAQVEYEEVLAGTESEDVRKEARWMIKKLKATLMHYTFLDALAKDFQSGDFVHYITEKYHLDHFGSN